MLSGCASSAVDEKKIETWDNRIVQSEDSNIEAKVNAKIPAEESQYDSSIVSNFADGRIHKTTTRRGKKNGYVQLYHPDSTTIEACYFYVDDSLQWTSFPWELNTYILPIKGLTTTRDCVEVKIPYTNGDLMYTGWLSNKQKIMEHPKRYYCAIGTHKVFYPSGNLQAIVFYDKDSIIAYNEDGSLFAHTSFRNWPMKMK